MDPEKEELEVVAGEHFYLFTPRKKHPVIKIVSHNYNYNTNERDIALLLLAVPITITDTISPIQLSFADVAMGSVVHGCRFRFQLLLLVVLLGPLFAMENFIALFCLV